MRGMNREWVRGPQWSSVSARERWAPVLALAAATWSELELVSVSAGVRPSALIYLDPGDLPKASADVFRVGLELTPLTFDPSSGIRAAVHKPGLRGDWLAAWAASDDATIGRLLGFPDCCAAHFTRTWVEERRTDTVLTQRTIVGPVEANVLLRQVGVRLVPHLPCAADCESSVDLGRSIARVGEEAGLPVDSIRTLLALAVEYSALHGVARVSTEPFRFFTGTDYTETEVLVTRPGTTGEPDSPWADNGFSTPEAMARAHAVVLTVVSDTASAIDLGCGDGSLLARVARSRPGNWWGVEVDADRAARGRKRNPGVHLVTHDLADISSLAFPGPFETAILMPGRIVEMDPEAAQRFRSLLPLLAERVVVYNYDGRDLHDLCREAGLPDLAPATEHRDGSASAGVLGGF